MKRRIIVIFIVVFFMHFFSSCNKENITGVCESRHGMYDYTYWCTIDDGDCDKDDDYTKEVYHNLSCSDLGYNVGNYDGQLTSSFIWYSPLGDNYPGDNGYFSSDVGGSTPSYCTDSYVGPGVGTQLDSYCQGAYTYLCEGGYGPSSEEVTTYCDLYDAMNDNDYPACGYCQ